MFDPDRLVWTSREEVTAALLSAINDGPERSLCALDLCADVAPPTAAAALLAIARARDRPYWARVYALRAHAATGASVPDDVCDALFAEWFYARAAPRDHGLDARGPFELRDLLGVVKTASHERAAMRWLAMTSADERAAALLESACTYGDPAPVTTAWLGDAWLASEGAGVSDENNRMVATMVFPTRPEALTVMLRHWTDRGHESEAFYADLARMPGLASLLGVGAGYYYAACSLRLPIEGLVRVLGARWLRHTIHGAVLLRSDQLAREDFTRGAEPVAWRYRGALDALRTWSEGVDVTVGLLRGVALAPAVRADLVTLLFARDPERAIALVSERIDSDDNLAALRVMLTTVAEAPATAPHGMELAHRALRVRDEGARYLAVDAIEAMGEASAAWCASLRALAAGPFPLVRVRALGSLALRGEAGAEAMLARAAVDEGRVEVRAEALRRLARLPSAGDHGALFAHALATDRARRGDDDLDGPAQEQAALALATVGGAEVMTALLRNAFGAVSDAARSAIKAGLRVGAREASEGAPWSREERARRVAEVEGWRVTRWSPLRATRMGRFGE